VFARRVIERTVASPATAAPETPDSYDLSEPHAAEACPEPGRRAPPLTRERLQALMWEDVGIVRNSESLKRATSVLSSWSAAVPPVTDRPSQELADLLTCSRLVAEAALRREESRGAHYRSDFPEPREEWRRHLTFRRASTRPA